MIKSNFYSKNREYVNVKKWRAVTRHKGKNKMKNFSATNSASQNIKTIKNILICSLFAFLAGLNFGVAIIKFFA